jgi:hypothetical protein
MCLNGLEIPAWRVLLLLLSLAGLDAAALNHGGPGAHGFQDLDVSRAPGPLSTAHAESPGAGGCASCHAPGYAVKPDKCLACHGEIAVRIKEAKGFHKGKSEACGVCHAEHRGPGASLLPIDSADFDHGETGYILDGAHANPGSCDRCHYDSISFPRKTGRSYLLPDSRCLVCHTTPHPQRGPECAACHTTDRWR